MDLLILVATIFPLDWCWLVGLDRCTTIGLGHFGRAISIDIVVRVTAIPTKVISFALVTGQMVLITSTSDRRHPHKLHTCPGIHLRVTAHEQRIGQIGQVRQCPLGRRHAASVSIGIQIGIVPLLLVTIVAATALLVAPFLPLGQPLPSLAIPAEDVAVPFQSLGHRLPVPGQQCRNAAAQFLVRHIVQIERGLFLLGVFGTQ